MGIENLPNSYIDMPLLQDLKLVGYDYRGSFDIEPIHYKKLSILLCIITFLKNPWFFPSETTFTPDSNGVPSFVTYSLIMQSFTAGMILYLTTFCWSSIDYTEDIADRKYKDKMKDILINSE